MLVMFATFFRRALAPRSEDGFMLLEVVISALLVGLIAVGTLSGIDGASRATQDERAHSQATVIAQQDEDRLRGLPFSQLARLGSSTQTVAENGFCVEEASSAWRYDSEKALKESSACEKTTTAYEYAGKSYSATVFTVTSGASFYSAAKEQFACETEKGSTDYIQTTSSVRWPALPEKRPAVSQSSLVAVPIDGSLLVKVKNRLNEPVSGATVKVYKETEFISQQTTPSSGCVIFGDLEEANYKVFASKGSWITHNGEKEPEKTTKVTPSSLAEVEFTLEATGQILAEFKNGSQPVSSFTATAYNAEDTATAQPVGGSASSVATTAEITKLFPFITPGTPPKENRYTVYAGDCSANKPSAVTSEVKESELPTAQVEPNETSPPVAVEAPEAKVTIYGEGTSGTKDPLTSTAAMIVNTECSKAQHTVQITNGSLEQNHLPYAKKLELCVVGLVGGKYYKNTFEVTNAKKTGSSFTFYLQSGSVKSYTTAQTCP